MKFLMKHFFKLWAVWAIVCLGVGGTFVFLLIKLLLKLLDTNFGH